MSKKRTEYDAEMPKNLLSTVLSGAGNGLMLGSIPLVIAQYYTKKPGVQLKSDVKTGLTIVSVLGTTLGAVFGYREAKEINDYRSALRNELRDLRARTEVNSRKLDSWVDKEEAREEARASAPQTERT